MVIPTTRTVIIVLVGFLVAFLKGPGIVHVGIKTGGEKEKEQSNLMHFSAKMLAGEGVPQFMEKDNDYHGEP